MKSVFILLSMLVASSAFADLRLASNKKKVVCYGADNQSITLNAARTTLKYAVEGESSGAKKIERVTKTKTSISYWSEEVTLTLGKKDTFQYDGGDKENVECK